MATTTIVSADIGGTNTRFILSEISLITSSETSTNNNNLKDIKQLYSKKYRNEEYPSFAAVFKQFLFQDAKITSLPASACFAVAGPVKDNKVVFTNRDSWTIEGELIAKEFQIPKVLLINDFLAVGYGLLTLDHKTECIALQNAPVVPTAPIACIGAGTGLGECFLTPANGVYSCFSSEGGHAEFAPRNDLEVELLQYLKHKFEQAHRISVERIVSGPGLVNIYEFLALKFPEKVDKALHAQIMEAGDLKPAIIASTLQNPLCKQTMEIFASAYGSEAGVAALKWLPFGGLYLTGGLTPKNLQWIQDKNGPFMKAFYDKGRVSGLLTSIPFYAVLVEDLGERGAQYVARKLIVGGNSEESRKLVSSAVSTTANAGASSSDCSASTACALTSILTGAAIGCAVGFLLGKQFR